MLEGGQERVMRGSREGQEGARRGFLRRESGGG